MVQCDVTNINAGNKYGIYGCGYIFLANIYSPYMNTFNNPRFPIILRNIPHNFLTIILKMPEKGCVPISLGSFSISLVVGSPTALVRPTHWECAKMVQNWIPFISKNIQNGPELDSRFETSCTRPFSNY